MENRQYMIFSLSEVGLIDFNEVLQTSAETLRKSNDGTKSFVKWESKIIADSIDSSLIIPALDENGQIAELEYVLPVETTPELYIPESVKALTTKEGPYTHEEILLILAGSNWIDLDTDLKA
jgi:hypothetical protein